MTSRAKIANFVLRHVDDSHADEAGETSKMAYWARDQSWFLSPAKSARVIRALLLRLRRHLGRDRASRD